jgi:hypothetical protein
MYAMSSNFGLWRAESLKKFLDYIKKQQSEGKEVDYLCFGAADGIKYK